MWIFKKKDLFLLDGSNWVSLPYSSLFQGHVVPFKNQIPIKTWIEIRHITLGMTSDFKCRFNALLSHVSGKGIREHITDSDEKTSETLFRTAYYRATLTVCSIYSVHSIQMFSCGISFIEKTFDKTGLNHICITSRINHSQTNSKRKVLKLSNRGVQALALCKCDIL